MHTHLSTCELCAGISAACYNVLFTSIPITFLALLDRPVRDDATLLRHPRCYNRSRGLTTGVFWKTAELHVRDCAHRLLACACSTMAHTLRTLHCIACSPATLGLKTYRGYGGAVAAATCIRSPHHAACLLP